MKGTTMRAFTLDSFDSPPRLRDDLPEPHPADNQLLVRVSASSVNPADAAIAGGMLKEMIEHDFPVTLGRDFAGTVEQTGGSVGAILDLVNFTPQEALLKEGGRLASPLGAAGEGAQRFNLMAQPNPENLQRLADLLDTKTLRVHIQETYDLAHAGDALQHLTG